MGKDIINSWYLMTIVLMGGLFFNSCSTEQADFGKTAEVILGSAEYQAISYGGYREITKDIQPTIPQLKEDIKILSAMGVKFLRTYNVHLDEASNLLEAIHQLRKKDQQFEMYVMLGAWIDCKNAWTNLPDRIRDKESDRNAIEIQRAVELTQKYPEIVKVIAVGNEAMVQWAWEYYVEPGIILKWVKYLQNLKEKGELPKNLWITSSDNFASWGGGSDAYHNETLDSLIRAVDFISMHTYPMHDTYYNPEFWGVRAVETDISDSKKIHAAMHRAMDYAINQYNSVVEYMRSLGVEKPVHIGETGWATMSNEHYGDDGSRATDEYKSGIYYRLIRKWTNDNNISCFYFEAFDEKWKDAANPLGSENHFGLINLESEAKYALWDLVDEGVFDGFTRDGKPITKTYGGDFDALMRDVKIPPTEAEINERLAKSGEEE